MSQYQAQSLLSSRLQWSSTTSKLLNSDSQYEQLSHFRNVLLQLQNQFTQPGSIVIDVNKKDQFNQRLFLLEHQIDGLLKRKINLQEQNNIGGGRVLDYSDVLNQKQNKIIQLQSKIINLQQRLRRANQKQIQLQNHINQLYNQLKIKQQIIIQKNKALSIQIQNGNTLNNLKKNIQFNRSKLGDLQKVILNGINLNVVSSFDINNQLSQVNRSIDQYQKINKTKVTQLIKQLSKYNNQVGISNEELDKVLQGFLIGLNGSNVKISVQQNIKNRKIRQDYQRLKQQFGVSVGIFQTLLQKVKRQNPNIRLDYDPKIFDVLKDHQIAIYKTNGDIVHLQRFSQKTIHVPVEDAKTNSIIKMLALNMKKMTQKYPKLLGQMDEKLTEFFTQQVLDIIQVGQMEKLVQIVKYQPQVVKVQNVYTYSNEKSKKIQYHLRVLIKALLQQIQKIKIKTGIIPDINQQLLAMINQQIIGIISVDQILSIFKVVPKIVQVQKIVQKVIDRIVQVPQIVSVQKIVQKIVQVQKIIQVQKQVNIPLQVQKMVPTIVQKIVPIQTIIQKVVQVPHVVQKIVQVIRQVPKIQFVQRIQQKFIQVQKPVQIQRVVNHIQTKIQQIQVIKQVIVQTQRIVQVIKQVPYIVQKIVQKIVQVPKIIQVQKLVQKIVPQMQVVTAQKIDNYVQIRYQPIDRIVQKPIPIIQTIQKVIQVPQIVQKIVSLDRIVQQIKQVERIVQKIVVQDRIIEITKQVQVPIQIIKQVPRQIQRIVQVPMIYQRKVQVTQIIQKPIIQRVQTTKVKQVYVRDPLVIKQPQIIQVQKIVNNIIQVPKPIKYIQQKIVQVIKYVDRIKQIKVPVQKIIQKIVQVPKVVQVQKIVQKIVIVPRVVQKVVQVPQIIQRIVPKIIIQQKIRQVERIVQVPMIQDRVVQIQATKNVYIEVEKIVQRIIDKIIEVPKYQQKIITNEVIIQKVIQLIRQVPRQIQVQKIVHLHVQTPQIVQIQKQIIVPIQIPVPVDKIVQKIVPITQIIQKPVQVPQTIQKIVSVKNQVIQIKQIHSVQQKIVKQIQYQQITKQVPYINQKLVQVQVLKQKIVPVQRVVQQIVTAQQIIQKIVQKTNTVPKIYDVQRTKQIVVQIPKIIQVERIIPQIINVNRYIQNIVQKFIQVPIIVQQIKQVVRQNQKIIQVRTQTQTIKEVQAIVQKAVVIQKFKQVVRNINHIQKVLQIIDRFQHIPVQVLVQQQKLVQVPYILQKIVQKIIVMPQIVQVLKYVHQVTQIDNLGVVVNPQNIQISTHQQKIRLLSKDIKTNFDILLIQLRKTKSTSPNLKIQIQIIEKFLSQLQQFILYPKIFQIPQEKIVEKIVQKDKIVQVPTQNQRSVKMQLTLSLLTQKLINQIKRIKKITPNVNIQLQDDVKLIFFTQLQQNSNIVSGDFNAKLKSFSDSVYRKFDTLGQWSVNHQLMLSSFLQQRFLMANLVKNSNVQIQKSKTVSLRKDQKIHQLQNQIKIFSNYIQKLKPVLQSGLSIQHKSIVQNIFNQFDSLISKRSKYQLTKQLQQISINDARIQSLIRQKDAQILKLRDKIFNIQKSKLGNGSSYQSNNKLIEALRGQILTLRNNLSQLQAQKGSQKFIKALQQQIGFLKKRNLELQQQNSNLRLQIDNNRRQYQVRSQVERQNRQSSKRSDFTDHSGFKSPNFISPVKQYNLTSPQYTTQLVQSQIKQDTGKRNLQNSGYSSYRNYEQNNMIQSTSRTYNEVGDNTLTASQYNKLNSSNAQTMSQSGYRGDSYKYSPNQQKDYMQSSIQGTPNLQKPSFGSSGASFRSSVTGQLGGNSQGYQSQHYSSSQSYNKFNNQQN